MDTKGRNSYLRTSSVPNAGSLAHYGPSLPAGTAAAELVTHGFLIRMSYKGQDSICGCCVFGETCPGSSGMLWVSWLSSQPVGLLWFGWQACTGRWGSRPSCSGMKGLRTRAGCLTQNPPGRAGRLPRLPAGTAYCRQVQLTRCPSLTRSAPGESVSVTLQPVQAFSLNILSKISKQSPCLWPLPTRQLKVWV